MATIPCEAIPREVPVAKPPKKPAPLDVEPPTGPVVHAKPARPPTERLPHWYWRAVVYDAGAERTVWTGRGARDEVRAAVWALIGRGEHIAPSLESAAPDDMVVVAFETVSDLLTHWRAHLQDGQSGLAPNTVLAYCRHSRPLEEVLGQVLLEQLGRRELDRYRAAVALPPPESSRRTRPRSTGSINCDFITLRAAWSWGRSIGAVDRDLQVPTVTVQPTRDSYTPTADEVAAVVEHLSGWVADVVRVLNALAQGDLARVRKLMTAIEYPPALETLTYYLGELEQSARITESQQAWQDTGTGAASYPGLSRMAGLRWMQGRHDEARRLFRQAIERLAPVVARPDPAPWDQQTSLAAAYAATGDGDAARKLIELVERDCCPNPVYRSDILSSIAFVRDAQHAVLERGGCDAPACGHDLAIMNLSELADAMTEITRAEQQGIDLATLRGFLTGNGIFAAVPYCIDLIGGPYLQTVDAVCKAFRPKTAIRTFATSPPAG